MRVYLKDTHEFERDGARHVARGGSFYELPDVLAAELLAAGKALPATERNEIIEPPAPVAEVLDDASSGSPADTSLASVSDAAPEGDGEGGI